MVAPPPCGPACASCTGAVCARAESVATLASRLAPSPAASMGRFRRSMGHLRRLAVPFNVVVAQWFQIIRDDIALLFGTKFRHVR
ncbi:hypothetical protein GCM10017643_11460 [Ancylobacter dichloromethanicus]|uniref:Uncharacterized protein n=1 Tax=Ancylobacter dichloromethanicus TaxID=518825 RepID=A0A9W6J742_9HYPH|nr:hypothetical protein GCM10017643_11460 [Ancylobacter dichloromethanicus]